MLGQANNFIKKRLQRRFFPVNIAKFLRTTFFIEHLWWLLLTLDLRPMNLGTACSKLRIKALMWRNFSFFCCCYWWHWTSNYLFVYFVQVRSSRLQVFRTGVLRNFAKFIGKQHFWSLFNKVMYLRPATLLKKKTLAQIFSY